MDTTTRTRMFARVIGPYFVIVSLTAALRASDMQAVLSDFEASPVWPWFAGVFTLLLGLVTVALHSHWSDPPAVIVSALGWLMVLRGTLLLVFPAALMSAANAVIGTGPVWRIAYGLLVVLGLYLTVVGWRSAVPRRAPSHTSAPV